MSALMARRSTDSDFRGIIPAATGDRRRSNVVMTCGRFSFPAPKGEIARDWIQRLLQDILSGKAVIVETGRHPHSVAENQNTGERS
jgi:hypothetical protein